MVQLTVHCMRGMNCFYAVHFSLVLKQPEAEGIAGLEAFAFLSPVSATWCETTQHFLKICFTVQKFY